MGPETPEIVDVGTDSVCEVDGERCLPRRESGCGPVPLAPALVLLVVPTESNDASPQTRFLGGRALHQLEERSGVATAPGIADTVEVLLHRVGFGHDFMKVPGLCQRKPTRKP